MRQCRLMRVSSSTTVRTAESCCDRSKATAACSAHTGTCRAHQSKNHARAVAPHRAAAGLVLPEGRRACSEADPSDWAGGGRSFTLLWGLPATIMLLASLFEAPQRTVIWTTALLWMGVACLANARRCGRTHCRFGPYFILMAASVVAFGSGLLALGQHGWTLLGGGPVIGTAA